MRLSLEVEKGQLDQFAAAMGATEAQIKKARSAALRELRGTIETGLKRKIAKEERIPQRALGDRLFFSKVGQNDGTMKVWVGTWKISPFSIASPRQREKGVSVGKRQYPGAFIAAIYSSQEKVWIRLRSPHYSPELYPVKQNSSGSFDEPELRGRFPVVRAAIPIDVHVEAFFNEQESILADRFETVFEQKLSSFVQQGKS